MAARPDRAERSADTVVHEVAGREITAGVVHRALARLTEGLDRALADARTGPDRTSVVAVGGAARSGTVARHLADRLGPAVPLPEGTDPALAAVLGAALVAGGASTLPTGTRTRSPCVSTALCTDGPRTASC